jgi:hypothetical protein
LNVFPKPRNLGIPAHFGGLLGLVILCAGTVPVRAFSAVSAAKPDPTALLSHLPSVPSLAILDPVDLSQDRSLPRSGQILRSSASRAGRFQVQTSLEIARKLIDFDWNRGRPCHEFQCAFDAGNILMADYIAYGTLTPLPGVHACSFHILETRTGKVVQSTVGQVPRSPRDSGEAGLRSYLVDLATGLDPDALRKPAPALRGGVAVVGLGEESTESRALVERLGTRIQSFRTLDLMGQDEMRELMAAMEIPLSAVAATDSASLDLGSRLKTAYLMTLQLHKAQAGHRLDLALFDIAGKRRIRGWSSGPAGGFGDILRTENRAFETLEELAGSGWIRLGQGTSPREPGVRWGRGLLTLVGIAAAGGIGSLAYVQHEKADRAYRKAEASMSPQAGRAWRQRTEERDRGAILFGSLAALTFGATVTLWAF